MSNRKSVITLLILAGTLVVLTAVFLPAAASPAVSDGDEDTAETFVGFVDIFPGLSFDLPVAIVNAGDDRLFVVEQPGKIWVVKGSGSSASKELFLEIEDRVRFGGERGLVGLVFHPQYKQNGYFYVNYIFAFDESDYTRVSRFKVSADPDRADRDSELKMLEFKQPYSNHNGGDLHFDPKGMLVIASGDGGSANDPDLNSQNPNSFLGKLLRIDVDKRDDGKNYAVPADNPFVDGDALGEIWALGLRNPWRFTFDRQTGDLFIGDVGQQQWEEINYVPADSAGGQNFEWSMKEGYEDFEAGQGQKVGPGLLTGPVYVYGHDRGCSITGGRVYRGEQMRDFTGAYFYADYCTARIQVLVRKGNEWRSVSLTPTYLNLSTFGEDRDGELYFAIRSHEGFNDRDKGKIYRLQQEWRQQIPLALADYARE